MIEHYHKKLHEAIETLRKLTGQAVLAQVQAAKANTAAADAASNG